MATKELTGAIGNDSLNMEALVDYIYYEPKKNIALKDFILNDSIRALIPTGKSVVYYFGDPFYNIVRIRLDKKNKNEILQKGTITSIANLSGGLNGFDVIYNGNI